MKPAYRPEIDGLRALAVVPVILYHAGFELFSGGYVGVDVFFVISGYLITTILLTEMDAGQFSLARFYERRARRILPALLLVMAACIPFAWIWMTPDQLRDFGRSLVAVTFFGSNFLFWIEGGYFQAAAEVKPLLHTWSLAVEEQYYLFFPLLLLALWRFGKRTLVQTIILLALLSLIIAQFGGNVVWLTDGDPDTGFAFAAIPGHAYFLMPARAWELLLGSLCAFYLLRRPTVSVGPVQQVLAACGLLMIAFTVVSYTETTPFPGFSALLPTVGTALIILCALPGTAVARLLAIKPLVAVGLISYSAYLWHHPLFAFARLRTLGEVTGWIFVVLTAATLVLAWLSWRFVEKPFRNPQRCSTRQAYTAFACASLVMVSVGLAEHFTSGFENRFSPRVALMQSAPGGDATGCNNGRSIYRSTTADTCTFGAADVAPQIAVLGDSHAASLSNALSQAGQELGISFLPINANWCAPLYNFGTEDPSRNIRCRRLMRNAINHVADNPDIDTVMLVAEWANYTSGQRWGANKVVPYISYSRDSRNTDPAQNRAEFEHAVNETLQRLKDKQVIIVKSVPEYRTRVPDTVAKSTLFADGQLPVELALTREQYNARNADVEWVWARVTPDQARFVDTARHLCAEGLCRYMTAEGLLYMDDNHLSDLGARDFVQFLQGELPEQFATAKQSGL